MNILVVFTGGTIGSTTQEHTTAPDKKASYALLDHFKQTCSNDAVHFTVISPLQILSETLKPQHWTTLIDAIRSQNLSSFDGIIITHGTDTLALTAHALFHTMGNIDLPVLLVSSHLPPHHPQTNAHVNFAASIAFIKKRVANGIFVAYQNPGSDDVSIFRAETITQSPQLSSHFFGISAPAYRYENGTFKENVELLVPGMSQTTGLNPHFCDRLLYIRPYPGIDYRHFSLKHTRFVLHDLYHSGTCDTQNLLPFIERCRNEGVALYMAPISKQEDYYETTKALQDKGVRFLYDMPIEAAMTKLMLLYGNFDSQQEIDPFL